MIPNNNLVQVEFLNVIWKRGEVGMDDVATTISWSVTKRVSVRWNRAQYSKEKDDRYLATTPDSMDWNNRQLAEI